METAVEHIRQANLLFKNVYEGNFRPLYSNTNEKLKTIFESVPVGGKTVLVPLSSSDYLFSSYYCGACSTDTFDINELTFDYFYLRWWSLMQRGTPDVANCDNSTLEDLIPTVFHSEQEAHAGYFWRTLLECHPAIMESTLFYTYGNEYYEYNVPFSEDFLWLRQVMENKPLSFTSRDFFTPLVFDKKYQVVFLSNILEYGDGDIHKLSIARDNLSNLLTDDGIVVASNLMRREVMPSSLERQLMENEFIFENGVKEFNFHDQQEVPIYYTYQKRKVSSKKGVNNF